MVLLIVKFICFLIVKHFYFPLILESHALLINNYKYSYDSESEEPESMNGIKVLKDILTSSSWMGELLQIRLLLEAILYANVYCTAMI